MPHVRMGNIVHTTIPRDDDDDIARAMNLIWPVTSETFTYATVTRAG